MICGYDEEALQEAIQKHIQNVNEYKNSDRIVSINTEPFRMEEGRETELNLANIVISSPDDLRDNNDPNYDYLTSKKVEELEFDRLEQLRRETQNNPELYSIETYIEQYESKTGNKISEMQIQGVRNFDAKIQRGLILGKYNLEDYITFLKSIPDLLNRKKFLAIGEFDQDGRFWNKDEIYETPSKEDISEYCTYTYHRGNGSITNDDFRVIVSPSIQKRMTPLARYKLCAVALENHQIFSPEEQETVKGNPKMRYVGNDGQSNYRIYSDESGILFAGEYRPTIKVQSEVLSADDISTALKEISREGLAADAQTQLTEQAGKQPTNQISKE